jgi:exosortase E/protease (VPEID-CTERM system)
MPKLIDSTPGQIPLPRLSGFRWIALVLLAIIELAWIRGVFSFPVVTGHSGLSAWILSAIHKHVSISIIGQLIIAFLAAFLLIIAQRWKQVVATLVHDKHYRWQRWLLCHAASLVVFVTVCWPVFGPSGEITELSTAWLIGCLISGSTVIVSLFLGVASASTWLRVIYIERTSLMLAVLISLALSGSVKLAQSLWPALREVTMWSAHGLLSVFYADVYIEPSAALLGAGPFLVEIAPACSGYEGIALITIFVSLYIWLFRNELTFPAVLLLFPIGIAVMWTANIVRIVMLIGIGASFSPEIAISGFHSQAGWIGFSIVSLGIIALAHRYFLAAHGTNGNTQHVDTMGRTSAASLLMPLLVLMAASMMIAAISANFPFFYPFGVVATLLTLWYFRPCYKQLIKRPSFHSLAIGLAIGGGWLLMVPENDGTGAHVTASLDAMPTWLSAGWIGFRVIGTVVTVPLAEELAFRGYLLRKLVANDFDNVPVGTFTWLSFSVSSLLFGLLHDNWVLGTLAGAGFAIALYQRGQISDAIAAHMTSNAVLVLATLGAGRWDLWG